MTRLIFFINSTDKVTLVIRNPVYIIRIVTRLDLRLVYIIRIITRLDPKPKKKSQPVPRSTPQFGSTGVWLHWTILRASPRYSVAPPQIHPLIKPSQIAVYPQIRICGLQSARGDQFIIPNDSTSSIFYPTSLLGTLDVKTGLTEFCASGRLSFQTYLA